MNQPAAATPWTRDHARAVEHDCARLVLDFYDAFDRGDYGAMARMFTAEGVWHRAGKALRGAGLVAELERRPASQRVRHIVTNVRVDALDADHAEAGFCITAYRGDGSHPLAGGGLAGALYMLVSVAATLERQQGNWLIASQATTREFVFPEASLVVK